MSNILFLRIKAAMETRQHLKTKGMFRGDNEKKRGEFMKSMLRRREEKKTAAGIMELRARNGKPGKRKPHGGPGGERRRICKLDVCHRSLLYTCLLYTSPSPRDRQKSRMPSSA